MSILTGPDANIYADTTIPGTSAVAMTEFQAGGNSLILILTTTTGGCGSLTFTAEAKYKIAGTDTAYADVIDRDSVWSMVCTTPNVAGVYAIPMEGLDLIPNVYYRLSYTAAITAGKLKVDMLNWENPKGGGTDISTGDIIADMDAVNTATAKSATTVYAEDTAHTAADPGNQILVVRNDTLASLCGTDGDYTPLQVNADGGLYVEVATLPGSTIADNAFTGATTIASTTAITTAFELDSITLHLSAAGTTNEDFTIGLDANAGTAYDTNLFTLDLSTDSIIDLVLTPEQDGIPRFYKAGDELVFVWPNTETRTYGIRIVTKGV